MTDASSQETGVFKFDGMRIEMACWIDGEPHFTAGAIGRMLGYKDTGRDVRKLVARNPYIAEYSRTVSLLTSIRESGDGSPGVNLTTGEGGSPGVNLTPGEGVAPGGRLPPGDVVRHERRDVTVYGTIGLQLIIFESRSETARQYKIAVAHLVRAVQKGDLVLADHLISGDLVEAARHIHSIASAHQRALLVSKMAEERGVSRQTIYRNLAEAAGTSMPTRAGQPRKPRYTSARPH
jgi:DNA-binding phage protein